MSEIIPIENIIEHKIDNITLHKMAFIYNALEDGWKVQKKNNLYIFKKTHEGKKEVYLDDYLRRFVTTNFDISKINT
jgi:hypothetical protein